MEGKIEDRESYDQVLWSSWKILLLRGIFISLIGLILLFWPSSGLAFTAIAFSLFIGIDGITQMVIGFKMNNTSDLWWGSVLRGVIEIIIAAVILSHPKGFGEMGAAAILIIIGIVLIIAGIIDFQFKRGRTGILSSILLIIMGVLLLTAPLFTITVILRIIGITAMAAGAARIIRAVQYKKQSI